MDAKSALLRLWELDEEEHGRLLFSIFLSVTAVLCGLVPYFVVSSLLAALLAGRGLQRDEVFLLCFAAFVGYLLRSILYAYALSVSHKAAFSILREVRWKILQKLPKLPLGTVADLPVGEVKHIIVDQVESTERTLAHLLPELTANLVGPFCIFCYLLVLDWRMALLAIVSIPVGLFCLSFAMRDYKERFEASVAATETMNAAIVEYIGGIEVIKAFNQGAASYEKFSRSIVANAAHFYQWMKDCQFPISLAMTIAPTTLLTVLPGGWLLYMQGCMSMEVFVTAVILSLGVAGPLIEAMGFIDTVSQVGTVVASADKLLRAEEQHHGTSDVELLDAGIELTDVRFSYQDGKEVLHGVSLALAPHTLNAFVGQSGSGKTTLARLIAGYWDIDSGSLKIGGRESTDIPLAQLYDLVSFVAQDAYLFDDSIRENIRMGRPQASDEEVERAARAAGCEDFILRLAHGYDTRVGTGGSHVSGGERQRIAIARAVLKDAPIVVLDEATAYVDPENEAILQRAVARLIAGKTVIIIAHRLSTITDADKIFLIEAGMVAASGTHEELLEKSTAYRAMWHAHVGAKDGDCHA